MDIRRRDAAKLEVGCSGREPAGPRGAGPPEGFWAGVLRAGAIVLGFVVGGLGAALLLQQAVCNATGPACHYEVHTMPSDDTPRTWLLDGFNVLHVGVLRGRERGEWWRAGGREKLLELVQRFDDPEAELLVVFDGPRPAGEAQLGDRVQVVFAPSADDWLLQRVRGAAEPDQIGLVTADQQLAAKARHRGARVVTPRDFLARCSRAGENLMAARRDPSEDTG